MRLRYKQKLFLYFSITFAIFSIGVLLFGQSQEKSFRKEILEEKLHAYTDIVNASLFNENTSPTQILDSLLNIFPPNLRLSLVDNEGVVLFDNEIEDITSIENHKKRIEFEQALQDGKGSDIRTSASNQQAYLYYARKYGNRYIRVALPYNDKTQSLLQTDNTFLFFLLFLFSISLILIHFITNKFSKSVRQLRDFALTTDVKTPVKYNFPKDELGEIGVQITENYRRLKESENKIALEREKLLQHIQASEEGICFFSPNKNIEFFNGLFIQYLNTLTEEPSSELTQIFTDPIFEEINRFLSTKTTDYFETKIHKQAKIFSLRVNIFEDQSFEVLLNDITKQEKTQQLKQEMTSNIAHELRTPLTSIRGYLETVLELPLEEEKKTHFIKQAYELSTLLSGLIQDMGLITKITEAPQQFKMEEVSIEHLLHGLKNDLAKPLEEKNIDLQWEIPDNLSIKGNKNLLYSIFRNLCDNVISYAGKKIEIRIKVYNQDKDFYYFSFYDTGKGIENENHLNRLFERFYRVTEGRTRETGGTGLGLSIVKNAIAFHKGDIIARNRKEGGLEFLFQLKNS